MRVARGKLRPSSLKVYDSRWGIFSTWCRSHEIDPWTVSVSQIADFLLALFQARNLKVRTIEGYRTAIASSLLSRGYQVGTDSNLSRLVDSFYTDRPVTPSYLPRWSLPLVLSGLLQWPFESKEMSRVEIKHLAFKAVFLLSLASGAMRSEIHALDHSLTRWSDGYKEVFLRPYVGFMAKTHVTRDPTTALRGFCIRSLMDAPDKSEPDRALCPIRGLRCYLHRTAHLRADRRPLFLPLSHTASGRLCPNTISSWIKQAISLAYEIVAGDEDFQRLHSIKAHECRALSAS